MRPTQGRQVPNWAVGLLTAIVVAVGVLYAFTGYVPFRSAYEVQAVFETSSNIRPDSPVRIAGVDVGTVTDVEHLAGEDAALADASAPEAGPDGLEDPAATPASGPEAVAITMEIEERGRPLHVDATMKLRPRLFLEGNLFVDLHPGSPSAPEIEEGHVFSIDSTSVAVQFDQVLTTLQADVREELQSFLASFGSALVDHGGAEGLRELFRTSPDSYRFSAEVSEALLGENPGDLSGLIEGLGSMVRALGQNEQALLDTITNLRIVTGALAAESASLEAALPELAGVVEEGPASLALLNAAFPSLRAFALEALPGVRSAPGALEAATPLLEQLARLSSRRELRALARELRTGVPQLARLSRRTVPFLGQSRTLSSCFNEVVIPWANDTVEHPVHPAVGRVFEETAYGLVGIAGESRSGDANGQYIRVAAGGGTNTVQIPGLDGGPDRFGVVPQPLLGAMPAIESSAKTPFRPRVRCETQDQPDLRAGPPGPPPEQQPISGAALAGQEAPAVFGELSDRFSSLMGGLADAGGLSTDGAGAPRARGDEQAEAVRELRAFMRDEWPELKERILSLGGGG